MDVFVAAAAAPPDQSRIANEIRDDENERSYFIRIVRAGFARYCTRSYILHTHTHTYRDV